MTKKYLLFGPKKFALMKLEENTEFRIKLNIKFCAHIQLLRSFSEAGTERKKRRSKKSNL